jgi:dTDP-4-dehydrorhamnose reductase
MGDRIVICGARGQVGRRLAREAGRAGLDVVPLTSAQWDITVATAGQPYVKTGDVVVNCAAFTAVDEAEAQPETAHAVNAVGARNVARTCARVGARLIHVSTDYVFSGHFDDAPHPYDIDDEPAPLSVYGRTKLAGEQGVHAELPAAHVVRTAWVFTGVGGDFVATIARRAPGGESVDVVADQIGSPTYVGDLVSALLRIAEGHISAPLLHAANAGAVSRFELARAVFEELGADPERVRPVGSDRHPRPAPRPSYSALSSRASEAAGLPPLRPWRDALAAALANSVEGQNR